MKRKLFVLFFLFSFALLFISLALADTEGENGVLLFSPVAGSIYHKIPGSDPMPEQKDWGPEAGLFAAYLRDNFNLIAFPYWASANGSNVWGIVSHADYYINTWEGINPLFGIGFDLTRIDVKNTTTGDTWVTAPWPKVGVRFGFADAFSITPYIAYVYEHVKTTNTENDYHSPLYGIKLEYNLHHAIITSLKYAYKQTRNGRNGHQIKFNMATMITKRWGTFLKIDYCRQIFDEYVTILAGPVIVF